MNPSALPHGLLSQVSSWTVFTSVQTTRPPGVPVAPRQSLPDRAGSVIEIQALWAVALAAAGDQDAAVDALAQALALGRGRADTGRPGSSRCGFGSRSAGRLLAAGSAVEAFHRVDLLAVHGPQGTGEADEGRHVCGPVIAVGSVC
jgi:hypothetical protein